MQKCPNSSFLARSEDKPALNELKVCYIPAEYKEPNEKLPIVVKIGPLCCIHNDDVVESTTSLPLHTVGTIVEAEACE